MDKTVDVKRNIQDEKVPHIPEEQEHHKHEETYEDLNDSVSICVRSRHYDDDNGEHNNL
ncbi:1794_t:CDS:2 [Acaulospora colombiana]|uniref:1794_t:CDS:1 n=1 Tax=Acaulospora colombiana TaxID=27376 RepID=A0ACA9L4V1_9GLOM|nr:1794_t:CDS:2 [Acaulospora colombiana]